jgi:hypothetical protein
MKRAVLLLGLTVLLGPQAFAQDAKPVDGKITWLPGYEEGKKQARQTGKPLFVVFRCER